MPFAYGINHSTPPKYPTLPLNQLSYEKVPPVYIDSEAPLSSGYRSSNKPSKKVKGFFLF